MENENIAKAGQYLTFFLKSQSYGVPIAAVREINQLSDIVKIPKTPNFVMGVMNLRGKVIPVVVNALSKEEFARIQTYKVTDQKIAA